MVWSKKYFNSKRYFWLLLISLPVVIAIAPLSSINADTVLGSRSAMMSNNLAGASSDYDMRLSLSDSASQLGSIEFLFCSNSSLMVDPCQAPTGFDATAVTLVNQSGETGFTVSALSNANTIIISRTAAVPSAKDLEYEFAGITNPSSEGSYFIRLITYSSTDASGTPTNHGGLAFAITSAATIQAQVPPYITFCTGITISGFDCSNASGDYIDFGELSPGHVATGEEELLVATNATSGYNINIVGRTMTSGNNTIDALSNNAASIPGKSQFGLNLTANTSPQIGQDPSGPGTGAVTNNYSQPNSFRFNSGELLASSSTVSDYKKYTVSYIVNRPAHQAPGVYATTMTFVALGNF